MIKLSTRYLAAFLLSTFVLLNHSACKKNDTEPEIPTGWQEGMTGKILYTNNNSDGADDRIYYIDKEGRRQVTSYGDYGKIYGPHWSPDGNLIVFSTRGSIYTIDQYGDNKTKIIEDNSSIYPDWSKDGSQIVFSQNRYITFSGLDGSNIIQTETPGVRDEYMGSIDWSPDGKSILISNLIYSSSLTKIYNIENGSLSELEDVGLASWSPDGSYFAFKKAIDNSKNQIFICDKTGNNERQVTDFKHDNFIAYQPAFSPGSDMIAFGSMEGVYVVDLDGNIITLIPKQDCYANYYVDWH